MGFPLSKVIAVTGLAFLLAACDSKAPIEEPIVDDPTPPKEADQSLPSISGIPSGLMRPANFDESKIARLEQQIVYFDFDRDVISPAYQEVLTAHGELLGANADQRVVIEGHGDERGTVEYNLALGERRAKAVRRFLLINGASPNQLDTVSFGEEVPAEFGSTEAAWSQNRRAVLKYQ